MSTPSRRRSSLLWKALKHRLDLCLPIDNAPKRIRLPLKLIRTLLPNPTSSDGERLRQALIELGPVYIKFGQLLSTRRDILSNEMANELAPLQDNVGSLANFSIQDFVCQRLERPWQEVFTELEELPLASASIAQVHGGKLLDGTEVAVKVVRPDIGPQIDADMALLVKTAEWVDRQFADARRLHLPQVARDHHTVLLKELDMFHEARNQIQLRRNFAESNQLYVPRVFADLTRSDLLVMERIYGIPIGDRSALSDAGVDFKVLAHKGVETFFTQVFEHNFFHADMHPGNIFIDVTNPADPRYIALDSAIVGSLDEADQVFLADNLVAFFNRDFARVADLFVRHNWVPLDTDPRQLEAVIREVCEPIFAKPLGEISFADFITVLLKTAADFEVELKPELALLQKTLLYVEGLGRQLYPELDLWQTAKPFMESWLAARVNPLTKITQWLTGVRPEHDQQWQIVQSTLAQQTRTLKYLEEELAQQNRRRKVRRAAGVGLMAASFVLLWQPLGDMLIEGDITLLAGMIGALFGSALIVRA